MQTTTTFRDTKTFEGKKNERAWKKIVFEAEDGREYATFDASLASRAASLLNVPVNVTYEEKPNGRFTNYDLKDVTAANGNGNPNHTPAYTSTVATPPTQHSDKDERITRAVALKAAMEAFGIAGQDPILARNEVIEYAETLIPWLHTGVDEG